MTFIKTRSMATSAKLSVRKIVMGISLLTLASCESLPEGVQNNLGNITAVGAGLTAGLICANNVSDKNQQWCLVAAGLAAVAGKVLGDEIAKNLSESEQRQVLEEATVALKTGKPQMVSLPESGSTMKITPKGDKEERVLQAEVLLDESVHDQVAGTFTVAGQSRGPLNATSVRQTPSASANSVASISSSEGVHVFGKKEGTDWYLVGLNAEGDFGAAEPVGMGFVKEVDLPRVLSGDNAPVKWVEGKALPGSAELVKVSWRTTCESLDFELDNQKEVISETSFNCDGPSGIPISG